LSLISIPLFLKSRTSASRADPITIVHTDVFVYEGISYLSKEPLSSAPVVLGISPSIEHPILSVIIDDN
jgi:hypothetical protein